MTLSEEAASLSLASARPLTFAPLEEPAETIPLLQLLPELAAALAAHRAAEAAREAALLVPGVAAASDRSEAGTEAAAAAIYPQMVRLPPDGDHDPDAVGSAFASAGAAMAWLEAERANLVRVVVHAAEHGADPAAWRIPDALRGYYQFRPHSDGFVAATHALRAAQRAGLRGVFVLSGKHTRDDLGAATRRGRPAPDFVAESLAEVVAALD